jgi:hypothetical protein
MCRRSAAERRSAESRRQDLRAIVVTERSRIGHIWRRCVYRSGAPRSMKMGTTASPWRYDAAARHTLQSVNLRRPAILQYAQWGLSSGFRSVVRLPFDSGHAEQSRDRRDGPRAVLPCLALSCVPSTLRHRRAIRLARPGGALRLWRFTLHDPGCCGVGPFPIGLAIQVRQLDHASELGFIARPDHSGS